MVRKKPFAQNKNVDSSLNGWWKRWRTEEKAKKAQQVQKIFKCAVCFVEFESRKLQDHYSSELHKELMDIKRHWRSVGRFCKTLDEQIEKKGSDIPCVGLQYMTQYLSDEKDEHIYRCTLCKGIYRPRCAFYHVLSIQHRILYLAKHHKSMGIDGKFQVNTREQYMHLMACTANAFQKDGMKEIKIVNQVYVPEPEVEQSVKTKNKGIKEPEPKTGPTGIGMDVINHALARLQPKGGTNDSFRSVAQQPASLNRPDFGRNPVGKDSRPQIRSSRKQEDLMAQLTAFLDGRGQMNDGDSAVQSYNDGKPAMMQEDPMINHGPMSHEGPAFRQAGINAPGTVTQTTMIGQAARPGMPQTAKPVAAQPVLPQHSTMLCRPPATIPFTKGDQGRSFQEFTVAHEAKMREMGRSEDLNSGSVAEKDDDSNFFWCNEELYDFLGHLTVESKGDVDYVLKATELFANSLIRHKQRTENIKKRIELEKKKLELEKKAFLNAPGVKELQKKGEAKSRSPSPACGAATKHKVTADSSSSNKPLFSIGSAPASTEPPSKAKRMMTLSSDSHRPPESDAYYQENEQFTGSQYGNTGSTGGTKSSYGPGAGRPGESDSFYKEIERFMNAQYGNSGSTGGTRPSYGAGAGRPEEPENERYTNSQYGATGGAKSSYGTTAGGTEGSKDNYGYNSGYVVAYPLKYSNSSTVESQNSQCPASMGSYYGMNQGNWLSSVPARSDNFPSKGPGAGNVQQQPYSSNQGTTSYDESWK